MTSKLTSVDYNPFRSDVMADPFPAYAELREHCPVHRFDGFDPPFMTVTRHEDVSAILRDWETWSSRYGQSPRYNVSGCLFSDPPTHTRYRRLVQRSFTSLVVERLEGDIVRLADELIDAMVARGAGDLHDDLACPLPVLVIADILGVPTAQIDQFKEWSDRQVEAMNSSDADASSENRAQLDEFFLEQLELRRAQLRASGLPEDRWGSEALGEVITDDVISALLVASDGGDSKTTSC